MFAMISPEILSIVRYRGVPSDRLVDHTFGPNQRTVSGVDGSRSRLDICNRPLMPHSFTPESKKAAPASPGAAFFR
jgi:hypothetical protein